MPRLDLNLTEKATLPSDGYAGALAGRVWRPELGGPSVVAVRADGLVDVSRAFPTMRDLCEQAEPAAALREAQGERFASLADVLANTAESRRDAARPWLLAPVDLQAVKAAGVTFATSMLERVIEERARGDRDAAAGSACSQRSRIVGKARETSTSPSARTATTEGPPSSGRQTRPARAPA